MPVEGPLSSYSKSKTVYPQQDTNEQYQLMTIVRKNDKLWHIVKTNYGGTNTQIDAAVKAIGKNNNIDPDKIFPGQRIKLLNVDQFSKIYPERIVVD